MAWYVWFEIVLRIIFAISLWIFSGLLALKLETIVYPERKKEVWEGTHLIYSAAGLFAWIWVLLLILVTYLGGAIVVLILFSARRLGLPSDYGTEK